MFGRKNTFGTTSLLAGNPSGPPEAEEGRRGGSLVCRASVRRGGAGLQGGYNNNNNKADHYERTVETPSTVGVRVAGSCYRHCMDQREFQCGGL